MISYCLFGRKFWINNLMVEKNQRWSSHSLFIRLFFIFLGFLEARFKNLSFKQTSSTWYLFLLRTWPSQSSLVSPNQKKRLVFIGLHVFLCILKKLKVLVGSFLLFRKNVKTIFFGEYFKFFAFFSHKKCMTSLERSLFFHFDVIQRIFISTLDTCYFICFRQNKY